MKRPDLAKPEQLISRSELARRWSTSMSTIKRREREGVLRPLVFNARLLRYRLSDIEDVELAAMRN